MLTPLSQDKWSPRFATHLLNRAGYGGTPEERQALYELGRDQGVAAAVDSLIATTETWENHPWPGWALSETDPNGDLWGGQGARRRSFAQWYFNFLKGGQPLASKLTKFFVDHFAVDSATSTQYTRHMYFFRFWENLRQHAAGDVDGSGRYGSFKTLVNDVSWSEAMIRTLDLYRSTANNINENFGRELLELFTMGVDGGYTEDDVGAAAEAFTGRKLYNYQSPHPNAPNPNPNSFAPPSEPPASSYQNQNQQDTNPKSILGFDKTPQGNDIINGDDAMEVIFANIQCASHLCWKLWRYFVSPNPEEAVLQELALRFRDTYDYEIRPLLRDIFLSEEFYDDGVVAKQIKDAADLQLAILSQVNAIVPLERSLEAINDQLGYNVHFPPNIAGWPEPEGEGNTWLAAGPMVFRMNMASIWSHKNGEFLSGGAIVEIAQNPDLDWDAIAPVELRSPENFPLLIEKLNERFLPLIPLRKSQVRTLYDRYVHIAEKMSEVEAIKEMIRLIMALPEYQMQ